MKKFLLTIMAIMVVCSMVGCGSSSDKPVVKDEVSDNAESNTEKNNPEVDVDNDDAEETDKEDTEDLDEEVYSNKVYSVGKDIPAGTYVVNCSKSDYGMDVVVFATEKEYGNFQNAEQFTVVLALVMIPEEMRTAFMILRQAV